jgi:AcrR family transcriptional regulator
VHTHSHMTTAATTTRTLSTADERRAELIDAAVRVFAERGYSAPTTEIAKAAGISQAYLFRLFPTKVDLFIAAHQETSRRMNATFREAANLARAEGLDPLEVMGNAYGDLLERDRDVLLVRLHAQTASGNEPAIRDEVQRCFRDLYEYAERETGASPERIREWFAYGMLCDTMASMDADHLDEPWARVLGHRDTEVAS